MAYNTSNPPALMASALASRNAPTPIDGVSQVGKKQPALWMYSSVDAIATVRAAGYISNARDLGMQVGDLVFVVDNDAAPIVLQMMIVIALNATTGAGDLSDGTAIDATNT